MKAMRRPLFWFNFSMWILSIVISTLLIQLGALIMSDVPTAGNRIAKADFIDAAQLNEVNAKVAVIDAELKQSEKEIEDARFVLQARSLDYQNQRTSFDNWLKTRTATESDNNNTEVEKRAKAIEVLKLEERKAERVIEEIDQGIRKNQRARSDLLAQRNQINADAIAPYERARKHEVLKVFGLRLALTLPLLLIAGWMVAKKRASTYWPIYRGFIIFSLFAFFVELVPYLPSYGGYVRYIVGIGVALIAAHFAIKGMSRYLEKKQNEEKRPETEKRKSIEYETAVKKISSGVCPSCDRQFSAKASRNTKTQTESTVDFCVHCGFCLFSKCSNCGERENSFYKFCGACGTASQSNVDTTAPQTA